MKKIILSIVSLMMLAAVSVQAQQQRNAPVPSFANAKEDFKPNLTNQPGRQYPMVNSQGAVRVQLRAPGATSVLLDLGKRYEMTKDENGIWTGTTEPQDVGFHYYQLIVDGTAMPDPNTVSFFGAGRWGSAIEIPSDDMDFWQIKKDVPQGSIVEKFYWSKATESFRHCYVYLPHEYDKNPNKKYPVLYLQHGNAENEYGWSVQGHTGQILDNLIAEKKAVPFIVVMDYGQGQNIHLVGKYAPKPQQDQQAARNATNDAFQVVLLTDIIPMVEKEFRVYTDAAHRGMAGLSMGGGQTRRITLANPKTFGYIGMFSGGTISPEDVQGAKGFQETAKLVFMSCGSKENPKVMEAADALNKMGVKAAGYVSEGTAHEWHTWRRSLYEFAQQIFK